jgi:hypothetical protein
MVVKTGENALKDFLPPPHPVLNLDARVYSRSKIMTSPSIVSVI